MAFNRENVVNELKKNFPEFVSSKYYGATDEKIPFLVYSDFCRYLISTLQNNQVNKNKITERAAKFFSDLYSMNDSYLKDLIVSGVLKDLADEKKSTELIDMASEEIIKIYNEHFVDKP